MSDARLLVVDDDELVLRSLEELLKLEGYEVDTATSVEKASAKLGATPYQIVITDVAMPEGSGFDLLKLVRNRYPDTLVVMVTAYGTIEDAVGAIKQGAFDYLTKPIIDDEMLLVVERGLKQQSLTAENRSLRRQLGERYSLDSIIGAHHEMLKVFDLVEAVATAPTTVLVTGESGTGKSMIARAIHHRSNRRNGPFVEVACGALPETLLESELFGHVKGAFTGAISDKAGKFKQADGGTIFLDEVSTAPQSLQVKLLRVLQELAFEPIGGDGTEHVDVRCILATNEDLAKLVRNGDFREDLYYRINVVNIHLPPLKQRIGDIPMLAEHFLERHRRRTERNVIEFSDEAMRQMQMHEWPGNVRELENVVERAVILAKGPIVHPEDLPDAVRRPDLAASASGGNGRTQPLKKALEQPEKEIIERALAAHHGNRQATAEALDINRTTLYKKMKKYGIDGM